MLQSFKNRLLILIVGLVLLGQGVTAVLALAYLQRNVRSEAAAQLVLTRGSLSQLLQERAERLRSEAQLLVQDFAFRDAVTSADKATVVSALQNHSRRIGADLALLYDTDGRLVASTGGSHQAMSLRPPLDEADRSRWSFAIVEGRAVQVVFAPVRAPEAIGWAALGFALDQTLVERLRLQTGADVSIVGNIQAGNEGFSISTLPIDASRALVHVAWVNSDQPRQLKLAGEDYLVLSRSLPVAGGSLQLIAQRSLDEVLVQYRQMRWALLTIVGATLLAAALIAWITGRNSMRPLANLVAAARRIQGGDYRNTVVAGDIREFSELADTLNSMQQGIREREERIVFGANHDALTGLPNRHALREQIGQCFSGAREASLLLVDVHQFRDINASVGHAVGDEVLQALAARLLYLAESRGLCARLGADQFAVASASSASSLLHRFMVLADELRRDFTVSGVRLAVELRGGVVPWSEHDGSVDVLLRRADAALLQAKESGLTGVTYQSTGDAEQQRRIMLVAELRAAIESRALHLVYQPMVRLTDRVPENYEALLRWQHATLGAISPAEFIPLAERASLMRPLSQLVLELAIGQLGEWRQRDFTPLLSVNLSAHDLADGDLCPRVLKLLGEYGVPPAQLLLEVTETSIMRDAQQARQIMHQLRMAGVRFAIDDFGTGHSSLAHLQRLPVDELKIDRSFVEGIENSSSNQAIVRAAAELAHSLGLRVVAEGVETMAAWSQLLRLGADVAQGYLISRPMPADEVLTWTKSYVAGLDRSLSDAERDGRVAPLKALPSGGRDNG